MNYPPPYDKGFSNSVFQATAFTNVYGVSIPTEFSMVTFRRLDGATSSNELRVHYQFQGTLTNVKQSVSVTEFVPRFPDGPTSVTDRRFAKDPVPIARISYLATTGWLAADFIRKSKGYAEARAEYAHLNPVLARGEQPPPKRTLVVGVFIGLSAGIGIIFLLALRGRSKEPNS
jgi:hypothetical protein